MKYWFAITGETNKDETELWDDILDAMKEIGGIDRVIVYTDSKDGKSFLESDVDKEVRLVTVDK